MTRVGASAGGPRGADQADELQRPCARTSGGDAAARRQGRGTEHSLLPLRPVSRQAHSQGRPGETPPRTSPVVGPTSARDAEPSPHRPPWHEAQRTQEHQGGQTPEPPARVPRPSDRSRGPGPRQLRSAHTQSRPAPRKRNRHRDALVCPSSQQPRGPGGDALRALMLGPSSPLTSCTGAGTDRPEGAPWDWGARRPAHDRPAVPPAHCPASPPRAGPWRCRSRTASGDARVSAPQYFSPSELLLQRPCPCRLYVERQGRRCQLARPPSCLPPSPAARPGPGCCPRSPPSPSRAGACRRVREAGWHVAPRQRGHPRPQAWACRQPAAPPGPCAASAASATASQDSGF